MQVQQGTLYCVDQVHASRASRLSEQVPRVYRSQLIEIFSGKDPNFIEPDLGLFSQIFEACYFGNNGRAPNKKGPFMERAFVLVAGVGITPRKYPGCLRTPRSRGVQ